MGGCLLGCVCCWWEHTNVYPHIQYLPQTTTTVGVRSHLTRRVEQVLKSCGAGLLWVTHDDDQPVRVGGSFLQLPEGSVGVISQSV